LAGVAGAPLLVGAAAFATSGTWSNNTSNADANWSTTTNWNSGNLPGNTSLAVSNSDTATFAAAASIETPILDTDLRLGQVSFDNSQADYNLDARPPARSCTCRTRPRAANWWF
jgi:hypothetical protein